MSDPNPFRPLLALETSGRTMSAAVWSAGGLGPERRVVDGARHGVALAPLIQEVLGAAGLELRELSAIAVSLGPGSWTGLRIGLAAGKSIAWASGIGLVGVPSFEALAWDVQRKEKGERRKEKDGSGRGAHEVGQESGVRRKDEGRRTKDEDGTAACGGPAGAAPVPSSSFPHPSSLPSAAVPSSSFPHPSSLPSAAGPRFVLPVRSAYSEGLYAALFAATGEGLERLMEDCVVRPEELAARVARALEARGRGEGTVAARAQVVLCGETSCLEALRHQAQAEGWRVLEGHDEITAGALAECAWRRLLAGQLWRTAAQIHSAAPLYLRASDPELKLRRRSGA